MSTNLTGPGASPEPQHPQQPPSEDANPRRRGLPSTPPTADPLLTVRTTVITLLAIIAGVVAGLLSYWAQPSTPAAILTALSASGGALLLFHTLIGK